jgi:hypothetical protein
MAFSKKGNRRTGGRSESYHPERRTLSQLRGMCGGVKTKTRLTRIAIGASQVRRRNQMCPFCIATAALIAGKVASTGGVAAIAIKKFGGKNAADKNPAPTPVKEDQHG